MPLNYTHDCQRCHYLGMCIGGGRLTDLFICQGKTLIARYGNEGAEYYATPREYARPNGHSELWAAKFLAEENKL